ncbi:MAG TPA: sigma-70 family RNA polymerase sigma factor [Blastocatellia bacterium]
MDEAIDPTDLAVALDQGEDLRVSDDRLAAAAALGDELAFEQLFIRHRYRVARLASRFFNRVERMEDIVQEVFTKIYLGLPDYSPNRGASFVAWMSRITINACYDHLRHDQRRPENAIDSVTEEDVVRLRARLLASPASADSEAELISRDLAEKLLAHLAPDDRVILALLDIEGLSVAEISEMTGWSRPKIKVRTHRARSKLRGILKTYI